MAYKTHCALCGMYKWRSAMVWDDDGTLICEFHKSQPTFEFGGSTISEDPGAPERLTGQLGRVFNCVENGEWWTLSDLAAAAAPATESAVSARLRDLRKLGHTVEREHLGRGLWRYRLVISEAA